MSRTVGVVVATGVVLAAAVVWALSPDEDVHDVERRDNATVDDDGDDWEPLVRVAVRISDEVRGVALPVKRPPELSRLGAAVHEPDRVEVSFVTGTQAVTICQADDIAETSCAQDGTTVLRKAVTAEGQTWRVVLLPADSQKGTADPTGVIAWWTEATYDETTPSWITDLAAVAS